MEQAIIKLELSVPAVQDAGSDELAVALQQIKEFATQIAPLETEIKAEISRRVTDGQDVPGWALQIREKLRTLPNCTSGGVMKGCRRKSSSSWRSPP